MGVDVINLIVADTGITQGVIHAAHGAGAIFAGGGNVMRIGTHPVSGEFAVNARTAAFGMFVFFKHQNAGALAHHKTVPILVPGAAGGSRVVIARRQCTSRAESADTQRRNRGFGAAGNHDVCITILDQPAGLTDAVIRRGASRNHGNIGSLQAKHDR